MTSNLPRKFRKLGREEKKDFILAVIMLRQEMIEESQKISYRTLVKLAESKLNVRIAPSTLGNILRKKRYAAYLLDLANLDVRFRREYDREDIKVLRLIPSQPGSSSSPLYEAWRKGIPTRRAKEIIEKLEFDGLIERIPDEQGTLYYTITELGRKLIKAIRQRNYKLNITKDKYIQHLPRGIHI